PPETMPRRVPPESAAWAPPAARADRHRTPAPHPRTPAALPPAHGPGRESLLFVRLGHPGDVRLLVVEHFLRLEVEGDFGGRRLGPVAAVNEVRRVARAEVTADRARFGLKAERLAHHVTSDGDRALTGGRQHDHRPGRDVRE